jgi:1,4-dihydroxy-2-naphthoate octaprenyltransferase
MTAETQPAPTGIKLWIIAVRAYAYPASVVPLLLGAVTAWLSGASLQWYLLPAVLLGGVLLHTATNLLNDRDDFVRGVDRPGTKGGNGLLVSGAMAPDRARRGGFVCLVIAGLVGVPLIALRGWPLAVVIAAGALGAWGYTAGGRGYKYVALGDPLVGILMGPLMVLGAHLALGAPLSGVPVLASLPVACLVIAILAANNLRDIQDDSAAKIKTLAIVLGQRGALAWYLFLLGAAYLSVVGLVVFHVLPWPGLAVVLSLPLALRLARSSIRGVVQSDPVALDVVVPTAQFHLAFGLLMIVGIVAGKLLGQ